MKFNKKILNIIIMLMIIFITILVSVLTTKIVIKSHIDTDYQKLGIVIKYFDVDYFTVYEDDGLLGKYKVYKIKNYYRDCMEEFKQQLETSDKWNKEKYYEYIMQEFYEEKEDGRIYVDRENVYYYHGKGAYAIFDLKNAKLYYFENRPFNQHEDYHSNLGFNTKGYASREIYSVRGGPQGDGTDYYVYKFNEEKGKEIQDNLVQKQNWSKEKLDNKILLSFEYNNEICDIENGYYHYKKVCRTSDKYKENHFTDEQATGYEIGVYDADKHILYYYWTSI